MKATSIVALNGRTKVFSLVANSELNFPVNNLIRPNEGDLTLWMPQKGSSKELGRSGLYIEHR